MTETDHGGWTIPTLKQRFDELRKADQRAVEAALDAAKEKADRHNDLIGAMKDQQSAFVTKEQATANFRALAIALGALASIFAVFAVIRTMVG